MGKIRTSWQIAKQCWRVLMLDKELLIFPIMSTIATLLVVASFALPLWGSGIFEAMRDDPQMAHDPRLLAIYFLFYLVNYFVIVFFNAALVSCALIRLRGGNPTIGDGFRGAMKCLPAIFGWAFLSAVVGMLLQAVEERVGFIGKFVVSLIGLAWAIASYFVIPVIVTENVGPIEALKRSSSVIRKTWGETLVTQVGLSVIVFGAGLLAAGLFAGGGALMDTDPRVSLVLFVLGGIWLLAVGMTIATMQAILNSALYLYAADGKVPANFDGELLKGAFAPKSK